MKYLCVIALVVLYANHASAGGMFSAVEAMGIKISEKCKATTEKWGKYAREKIHKEWLIGEVCAKAKCKGNFEHFEPMWPKIKGIAGAVLDDSAKQGAPDLKNLPGSCAPFNKDVKRVMWPEVDKIVKECVTDKNSPGYKALSKEDPCKMTEEKLNPVKECVKGKAMPLAMNIALPNMDGLKKCANEIMEKYCNEEKLGSYFKRYLVDMKNDMNMLGENNAYKNVLKYTAKCQPF